ncbi:MULTISPECIES: glycosyltransferase family 8 protein [Paenibacillus]|uniref:glycosyltransferase family 8 protein n=1 Tax=Paenibacillus TaxID=44249 RepID=UPI002FDF0D0D
MIELALAFQDKDGQYAEHAGVVLASIFHNTKSAVNVHILHDETLSEDNRQKLFELATAFNQTIQFYPVAIPEDLRQVMENVASVNVWTTACMYRLLIPGLVPVDKIIYLDCDILVNMDIEELWKIELNGAYLGAVWDQNIMNVTHTISSMGLNPDLYFNSGVILFDLNSIRQKPDWYGETLNFFRNFPGTTMPDQDALNAVYGGNYLPLDLRFNLFSMAAADPDYHNKIVHFAGEDKCWDRHSPGWELYLKYLSLTPWSKQAPHYFVTPAAAREIKGQTRIRRRKRKATGVKLRSKRSRIPRIALPHSKSVKSAGRRKATLRKKRRGTRRRPL